MDTPGSVWRKWDFHVHTPASYVWQGGKHLHQMTSAEKEATWTSLAQAMDATDVAAFVIMDYWTFDGYIEFREFLRKNRSLKPRAAVFPGMELRCEAPTSQRLNLHVILSDQLTNQQLQDFKSALHLPLVERNLSDDAIAEIPHKLTADQLKPHGVDKASLDDYDRRLQVGFSVALVSRDSVAKAFEKIPDETGLLMIPFDTYGALDKIGLDPVKHAVIANCFMRGGDIFEVHGQSYIDCFRGTVTKENKPYFESFFDAIGKKPKPTIAGSDAHCYGDYGKFPCDGNGVPRICWVKSDTTFQGLRQIINEPVSRTFIGEEPPKLIAVRKNPTKYMRSVTLEKKSDSTLSEAWFNSSIELNPGLVAIIGNKGSGKSALTDVLGLLGDSKNEDYFSFLDKTKFRRPKGNKAEHFTGRLVWENGTSVTKSLNENVATEQAERVTYIPQFYLETICNEIRDSGGSRFDHELKSVIYSHVPAVERLGKPTLDELLEYKSAEALEKQEIYRQELCRYNKEIAILESKLTPEYRQSLESQLAVKQGELDAHDQRKPQEVQPFAANDSTLQAIDDEIAKAREAILELETLIQQANQELSTLAQISAKADAVKQKLANLELTIKTYKENIEQDLVSLAIPMESVITFAVDLSPLDAKISECEEKTSKLKLLLDGENTSSYPVRKAVLEARVVELKERLEEPGKAYQEYRSALAEWETQRLLIIGDANTPETLQYYQASISALAAVPDELRKAEASRLEMVKYVYSVISELAQTYRDLYKPVQDFVQGHRLVSDVFGLRFDVSINPGKFMDSFFSIVSHGSTGSFYGVEEGEKLLKTILAKHDLATEADMVAFIGEVLECLRHDRRNNDCEMTIEKQLKRGQTVEGLYNLLFSLDYLKPQYTLKLGEKDLAQLSPGERGSLLLMFYLLVDNRDIPLIIDQPEENLDNQTVYTLLGECIKEAKERRQIIIVTHNPNLAVACDAEQIICAKHDGVTKSIAYTSGSIESPEINKCIVDILEGTRPAFDNREAKYQ